MTGSDARAAIDRRRARRADAARLLPILGAALFLAPDLILSSGPGAVGATRPWLFYLFAAWLGLIGLAWLLARSHLRDPPPPRPTKAGAP